MTPIQQILLGGGGSSKKYVDEVFSTYLWFGNETARTIPTGVDNTKGALAWVKSRNDTHQHHLVDTARGANLMISSDSDSDQASVSNRITGFTNNGFTIGSAGQVNGTSSYEYLGWNFREAKGFFDIVTYAGTGTQTTVSHNLGCAPGCIMVKRLDDPAPWAVWHRGSAEIDATNTLNLNLSSSASTNNTYFDSGSTPPTSTDFTVHTSNRVNQSGASYVAYVFAGGESTAATARSVDFDGNDYLSVGSSSDFTLGTNNFTLETWIYPESCTQDVGIPDPRSANTNAVQCMFGFNSSLQLFVYVNGGFLISPSSSTAMTAYQWQHVAYCRSGSTGKIYLNGIEVASVTDNNNYVQASAAYAWHAYQGATFVGKLSNARIVNGTAVYTSSFRPPTEPLTNITNTKLLCCNNASVTGSTVTPGTITANGDPAASQLSPFDDPSAFTYGDSGSEGIIKCGSYIGNGSTDGPEINIGWEPQWVLVKGNGGGDWQLNDSMRGVVTDGNDARLWANLTNGESSSIDRLEFSSKGFNLTGDGSDYNGNGNTYLYIALRRSDGYVGKPPELGTEAFAMDVGSSSSTIPNYDSGFPVDFTLQNSPAAGNNWRLMTRLTESKQLRTNDTTAESTYAAAGKFDSNVGYSEDADGSGSQSWMWKRNAGCDVVYYDGQSDVLRVPHNLAKTPEMIWVKARTGTAAHLQAWKVYHEGLNGGTTPQNYYLNLNNTNSEGTSANTWNNTAPTSTHFTLGSGDAEVNYANYSYMATLFASIEGISKCGYYTGNGSTSGHQITLGFQPRFLIVKDASQNGNWNVFDTTRGWNGSSDWIMLLNATNASANIGGFATPNSTGFNIITDGVGNNNGINYIYYAHA